MRIRLNRAPRISLIGILLLLMPIVRVVTWRRGGHRLHFGLLRSTPGRATGLASSNRLAGFAVVVDALAHQAEGDTVEDAVPKALARLKWDVLVGRGVAHN